MIKKWQEFLKENIVNPDSYLDMRMQEIKSLLDTMGNDTLIYEWENQDDHKLFINFSANGLSVRYEFDIDNMILTKIVGDVTDFTKDVESMESGVASIQKDIHGLLGMSESYDSNSLVIGKTYIVTFPAYDDYEEGLEDEVMKLQVLSKSKDSYLFKDLDNDTSFTWNFHMLDVCEIKESDE